MYVKEYSQVFVLEYLGPFSYFNQECLSFTPVEKAGYDSLFVELELGLEVDVALPYTF